jgi:hypothetical protein
MKKAISFGLALAFVLTFFVAASAEPVSLFYGQQWDRYDYQVYGGSYAASTKSNNTFTIPRTYLRYKLTDDSLGYEGNLTLDINNVNDGQNSKITVTGGNVTAAGGIDWAIWVKKASVDFKKIPFLSDIDAVIRVGQQDVYFGAIDTWQYPVIEKALEDKNGVVSSADQGIALLGKIPQGFGAYELAIYNGFGYKTTDNDATNGDITDKAYDASLLLTPIAGIYVRGSYFHKMTSIFNAKSMGYNATALVLGGASGPIEGFVEYVTDNIAKNYTAGSKSGVSVGVSGYIGFKLTDMVSLHLRMDEYNLDTRAKNDEINTYIAGVNLKLTPMTVLQLNYQLDANKFPSKFGGAGDNNLTNNNQFLSQLVWSW